MPGTQRILRGAVAGLAVFVLTGLSSEEARAEVCGTTWTTACASVSVLSNGNTLVLGVSNVSTGESSNALFDWLLVDVSPEDAKLMLGSAVWANCGPGFDPAMDDFAANCDDISDEWGYKVNNQGGIEWNAGLQTGSGKDGIVNDTGTCNGDCWTGPVYFEMAFDETVDFEMWAIHAKRLGPDEEESEWIQVPEPMTTTLLGIGVAGWLGAGLRRRRKDALEDEDNLA